MSFYKPQVIYKMVLRLALTQHINNMLCILKYNLTNFKRGMGMYHVCTYSCIPNDHKCGKHGSSDIPGAIAFYGAVNKYLDTEINACAS